MMKTGTQWYCFQAVEARCLQATVLPAPFGAWRSSTRAVPRKKSARRSSSGADGPGERSSGSVAGGLPFLVMIASQYSLILA